MITAGKKGQHFHTATTEEIKSGQVVDVYFSRTKAILEAERKDRHVVAEFVVKRFPEGRSWGVLAGLEEGVYLLRDLNIKVWAMDEGTIFHENEPVLVIEGNYLDFGVYETAILGLLCQASGVATKAARCKKAAGDKIVLSFGARRMHPVLAPMIERNAYIGGCDGVAVIKSAELLGIQPAGTIPHTLVLILGDTVEAVKAFDRVIDPKIGRVALIDTFNDEKFEAIHVAEAMGRKLYGIRLDTPGSRRGNFLSILKEVRWELDLRGYKDVKIFVSGGIDENKIPELNSVVDAYGIGTSISSASVLDFAMDIVEIEGEPIAKRGKPSGRKEVYQCPKCRATVIVPYGRRPEPVCECGASYRNLLKPILDHKKLLVDLPDHKDIRAYVLEQLGFVELAPI
ncbi:nicotinate phosphoribosyltransferase pncB2 [bacterium BMS3Abin05]|nr:nicotinate phosphoribosyltransferase pncB2 [bacterium BMS3Abin05]GBE28539.1 nicotinate phosphoribosyltransferase pncB2 [bacterium BMS3Bbin03]